MIFFNEGEREKIFIGEGIEVSMQENIFDLNQKNIFSRTPLLNKNYVTSSSVEGINVSMFF